MNKSIKLFSTIVVGLLLTACGGGGATNNGDEATTTNATISGTAVDELILNGVVAVKKPNGSTLVTGRTSSTDGTYSLEIPNYSGPVIVNVTCDGESKLKISDTEEKACPSTINLNSVATIEADRAPIKVTISPLSEIVYKRALEEGGITDENIQKASAQIASIFGIDPILTDPTSDTYDKIITSFHDAIDENDSQSDIFSVINNFVEDIRDNNIDNSSNVISALRDANVTNALTKAKDGESIVINDNPAPIDTVVETKDMIQSLRTQATHMEDFGNDELKKIENSVDSVRMDLESASDYVVGIIDMISKARDNSQDRYSEMVLINNYYFVPITITKSTTNEWSYTTENETGTITIPEVEEGTENTFTTLTASFSGTMPYVKYNQETIIQTVTLTNLTLTKTPTGADVLLSGLSIESNGTKISVDEVKGSVGYTGVDGQEPTFNFVILDTASLTASTSDYELKGKLTATDYVVNKSLEPRGGFETEEIGNASFYIYCSDWRVQLTINSASLNLNGENYLPSSTDNYYNYGYIRFNEIIGNYDYMDILSALKFDATCSDSSQPHTSLSYYSDQNTKIGNSGKIPTKVSFVGSIKSKNTTSEINGTLNINLRNGVDANLTLLNTSDSNNMNNNNDDRTNELLNNLDMKISLNGTLIMPNRPKTLINLGYETKADDDAHKHSLIGSYAYDTTMITMSGDVDKDLNNGIITFTNGTGIEARFIFKDGKLINGSVSNNTGSLITKDGAIIASIEDRGHDMIAVKYLDGYFETIF